MGNIEIKQVEVAGPDHPSFGLERAWYTFGVFNQDGAIQRLMLVEAENRNAVHVLESLVQTDGSVSPTCGLVSVSSARPQVRSTAVDEVTFVDFMIDMVQADRWLDSPFLIGLFQNALSSVDRAIADMKVDQAIRLHEWEKERAQSAEPEVEAPVEEAEEPADDKLTQLQSGLSGLGFAKRDVQNFVLSVKHSAEPLQALLMEGIRTLNRGVS